jgi:hypothetical protein
MNNETLCKALYNAADVFVQDENGCLIQITAEALALVDAYRENERCIDIMMEKNDQLELTLREYRKKVKQFIDSRTEQQPTRDAVCTG